MTEAANRAHNDEASFVEYAVAAVAVSVLCPADAAVSPTPSAVSPVVSSLS